MGIRFDLNSANWLAYLIEPEANVPSLSDPWMEREALRIFLSKLRRQFYSSHRREEEFRRVVERAEGMLEEIEYRSGEVPRFILRDVRRDLGNRPWTALIVPSGEDWQLDKFLTSEDFLLRMVGTWAEDPGLILQIDSVPDEIFSLTDVFPAFRVALAEATKWPGLLVWTHSGDSAFFPFDSRDPGQIDECAGFLLSRLARGFGADLETLAREYRQEFQHQSPSSASVAHLLHLSDIHLGCKEASRRLPRVQQLIRNLLAEFAESDLIIPVVSGDLMDSPSEDLLDRVRAFLDFLSNLGTEAPVVVLGNHDVRADGYLEERLKQALRIPTTRIRVFEDHGLTVVGFNSVVEGRLARGFIGEQQFIDIGNELDRVPDGSNVVGVVHHHPTPVERPNWYAAPFYERLLGGGFEKTDELEDAHTFLQFVGARSFAAVLHGHKHIPRIDQSHGRLPIYGCGSTVGKVPTRDRFTTYMSINVVTVDSGRKRISGRLLAERIPGGGLVEDRRHEIVHRGNLETARDAA